VLCVHNSMNENELIESAKKQSVKLYPLSPYDFVNDLRKESYVLLGFGSIPENKIETLARLLKDAWFPSCKETF
ncbi:PLP-dependent aminotransferase family protein, partial [Bacillus cereus]|nr:PLP-dependent aminotransferase family protein [Bacillus cereus]